MDPGTPVVVGGYPIVYSSWVAPDAGPSESVLFNIACGGVPVVTGLQATLDIPTVYTVSADYRIITIDVTQLGAFSIYAGITVKAQ